MTLLAFVAPATARNVLLVIVGGCYLGYHLFHLWRRWREKMKGEEKVKVVGQGQERISPTDSEGTVGASVLTTKVGRGVSSAPQSSNNETSVGELNAGRLEIDPCRPAVQQEGILHCSPSTLTSSPPPPPTLTPLANPASLTNLSGEGLYAQARAMPHQPIPDYEMDGEYLRLLAKSAELGYPRALAKLGDYALRRDCLVEAYYWLWRAKKAGMGNLERTMLQVRSAWANGDFRRESMNEYKHFSCEQGDVGYALLCIDARHNAAGAKAFLAERAPDLLD